MARGTGRALAARMRTRTPALLVALGLALALVAAGCGGGGDDDAADAAGGDDTGGSQLVTCETATDCDDGDECTRDECAASGVCTYEQLTGDQPTGAPCDKDCDCEGGLCYGEAYLSPNRFCTKECGGVSEGCSQEGACMNFSGALARENGLTVTAFCMPRCTSAAECTAINPALTHCPAPNFTTWKDATVGAPTCTILEEGE